MSLGKVAPGLSRLLLLTGLLWAQSAHAETITIACEASPVWNAPAMTIVYEGEAEGTLTIAAPFGEMRLPATKESRQGTDENGQPLSATGIRAFGTATVQMPDMAAIESCVKGKLPPDQLADSDMVSVTVMGCANEVPLSTGPVAINASAELALEPIVYVGLTRTYADPTDLAGGTIALNAYPKCSIEE